MSTQLKYILFSVTIFATCFTFGQTTISGEVKDSVTDVPMEYVALRLFSVRDSTIKGGAYTNEKGRFIIENVQGGEYYIVASFAGYENQNTATIAINNQQTYAIGRIVLSPINLTELQGVEVVGKLDVLRAGIDKKVYNVDQDVASAGASADEVLNNIPSITLDEEGRISLRGEGSVTVLINGQPSSMTGEGGDLLNTIPASTIERIEVVTNPSAKYDPDGTAGIINIVLKKNRVRGMNGIVSATGGLPDHNHKLNTTLNFRNQNINVFASYAFDYMEGFRNNYSEIARKIGNDSTMLLFQDRIGTDKRRGHVANIGVDWYFTPQTTFGISANGQMNTRIRTGNQYSEQYFDSQTIENRWDRITTEPRDKKAIDLNAYLYRALNHDLGSLSASANYSISNRYEYSTFIQDYSILGKLPTTQQDIIQQQFLDRDYGIFTAQADLERIVPALNARYELGAKTILRGDKLSSASKTFDHDLGTYQPDNMSNFDYSYNENVYSLYGIFGQELGAFKYQVGLRGEYALQAPELHSDPRNFKKEYAQLYPSGHLRYLPSDRSEWSLGYSRRINRPSSKDLNPYANYSDPFNLRMGNPDLKPEYINSFDLAYTQNMESIGSITASAYYRHTTDVIQRIKVFYDANTAAQTMANINESHTVGLELIYQVRPLSWWRNTLSLNSNYIDYQNPSDASYNWNNNGINWGVKYMGAVDFWNKTASFQVNATYNAPRITPQGKIYLWNFVDVSLQKHLLDRKLTVGLKFVDLFNIKGFKMRIDQPTLQQYSTFDFRTRRLLLSLTYKFGKMDFSEKPQRRHQAPTSSGEDGE